MNYLDWPIRLLPIGNLLFDTENARIPGAESMSQAQLWHYLIEHEDVITLAKNIARHGFYPTEILVAIRNGNKHVVVEGNRRLAACKAIYNPDGTPDRFRSRFKQLHIQADPTQVKKIQTAIAPSREETIPLVKSRHTDASTQPKKWATIQQATWYQNLLRAGISMEDLAERLNVGLAELRKEIRTITVYGVACSLENLPDDVREKVKNPVEFNITTLTRVFDSPEGRDFLGVVFDSNGELHGRIAPEEFKKGLRRLVVDVAEGRLTSRNVNKKEELKNYLSELPDDAKPDHSKRGSFSSSQIVPQSVSDSVVKEREESARTTRLVPPVGLIPKHVHCPSENARVVQIYRELRGIRVKNFKNATAVLLRSLIEVSVYDFLHRTGELAKWNQEIVAQTGQKPKGNWPELRSMLTRIRDKQLLQNPAIGKVLGSIVHDHKELWDLNLAVHNFAYHPQEDRLRAIWLNVEEMLKELWS